MARSLDLGDPGIPLENNSKQEGGKNERVAEIEGEE